MHGCGSQRKVTFAGGEPLLSPTNTPASRSQSNGFDTHAEAPQSAANIASSRGARPDINTTRNPAHSTDPRIARHTAGPSTPGISTSTNTTSTPPSSTRAKPASPPVASNGSKPTPRHHRASISTIGA